MSIIDKAVMMGAVLLLAAGLAAGCGSLKQARRVSPSGFLGDYSQLKEGGKGEARLVYVNRQANFNRYDKILLEPVCIYAGKDGKIASLPREDRQRLVNHLDAALRERLKKTYTFVDRSGPGVMRLRVAITEAKGSRVLMDTVSSVMPIGLAVSGLKELATGSPTAVGSVGGEVEALDSVTRERLFAAVDAQVGQKITGKFDKFNKWRTAEAAFNQWSERIAARLQEMRSK